MRNRAILAMLIGCSLRRAEVVAVAVEDFELREDHWVLADLIGKAGHMRTIPIQHGSKQLSMSGLAQRPTEGVLFCLVGKTGKVRGSGFTAKVDLVYRPQNGDAMWIRYGCAA